MDLLDLPTPAAIVDLDVVERNTTRMADRMKALGVRLRPHVKTHKCLEAARLQVAGHFGGITVSTLAEARFFAAGGFRDITHAVPLAPARAAEALEISGSLARLSLVVDSVEALDALEATAAGRRDVFEVLLKVDCGYHRAGVDPLEDAGVNLAKRIYGSASIEFRGILAHAGHSYRCRNPAETRVVAEEERAVTAAFADRLRGHGVDVIVVSIGSTPTMSVVEDLDGITEVRPGNYAFYDQFQAVIGSCTHEDRAFSVLTTVIGAYPQRNLLVVDAGALALSKDLGPTHVPGFRGGYGAVDEPTGEPLPHLDVFSLSQEHGLICSETDTPPTHGVGRRLRVYPNHSCLSAALFDRYHVVRGTQVVDEWRPCRGW